MSDERQFSMDPDDGQESGGFLDGATATIVEARTVIFTYPNTQIEVPALRLVLDTGSGRVIENLSAGKADRLRPAPDGSTFEAIKAGVTGLDTKSKAYRFLRTAIDRGVPKSRVAPDVRKLTGVRVDLAVVREKGAEGRDIDYLVVARLVDEHARVSPASGATGSAPEEDPAQAAASEDVADEARMLVLQVMSEHKSLSKRQFIPKAIGLLRGNASAPKILAAVTDALLKSTPGIAFDGTTIVMEE